MTPIMLSSTIRVRKFTTLRLPLTHGSAQSGSFASIYVQDYRIRHDLHVNPDNHVNLLKLHLYHNQEEIVYDHVFVRIVSALDARTVAASCNCSGTAATTSIAVPINCCHTDT